MSKNNKWQDKLKDINPGNEKPEHKREVIHQIVHQEEDRTDFEKIAEELQQRHEEEKHSLNDKHVKMTIYVEENIAKAFYSLCVKRGDQKEYINQALAEFVKKRYKELQQLNRQ